ncbi:hypothetical protein [Clostridium sp. D53t1_180928_C8]|uniref:DUF6414 family protein n=1 Tax=Clostridium sp. D53t1_180928_C8 TaxID=2787101 RepID=UPI0018AC07F8|nr:hypothetical protein [Clostridium sp. D53t1_180928_C8]
MQHFIYLNTDMLNSYLSQINDGIVNKVQSESYDEVTNASKETVVTKEGKFQTDLGIPGFFTMKFTETPEGVKTANALTQLEYGKELIEKMLHDNALQQFMNYLNKNNLLKSIDNCDLNDYVSFSGNYNLKDLDYILSVYTDEYINFLADNSVKNLNASESVKKLARKKEFDAQCDTRRIFRIAKTMLPSAKFIECSDCFVPLDDNFLRESTKSIRFNYTGKISIIGKYVSTLEKSVSVGIDETSSFGKIFASLDDVNKIFYNSNLGIPLTNKVILPIALYFE